MIRKKKLGVDIDGVLADTLPVFLDYIRDNYGIPAQKSDITDFSFEVCLGITPEQSERMFADLAVYIDVPVIPGALSALYGLDVYYDIWYVTHRPISMYAVTYRWLSSHGFPNLFISHHVSDKAQFARFNRLSYFVEDSLQNINLISAEVERAFLLTLDGVLYNQGELEPNVERVYSWDEVVRKLVADTPHACSRCGRFHSEQD